jgi:hypothetical protein
MFGSILNDCQLTSLTLHFESMRENESSIMVWRLSSFTMSHLELSDHSDVLRLVRHTIMTCGYALPDGGEDLPYGGEDLPDGGEDLPGEPWRRHLHSPSSLTHHQTPLPQKATLC